MQIHGGTDHGVEENYKHRPQGASEKPDLSTVGEFLSTVVAAGPNEVEHHQSTDTHSRIDTGGGEVLQSVDDHHISRSSGGKIGLLAKHVFHLTGTDAESGSCHEGRDGRERNEVDDESETSQSKEADNATANDGHCRSDYIGRDVGLYLPSLDDHFSDQRGHYSDRTDRDILGRGEEPINQDTHERGVKTELNIEFCKFGIGHSLRDNHSTNRDTWDRSAR